ncbi:MAG: hypothetical protein KA149_00815 [Chitinophagales bacterium]|nr:hypothetical protein [Chitinophagales bacterium]
MKKQSIKTIIALVLLTATFALNSCKKEKTDSDLTTANNMAMADESYNDADNIADEAATTGAVTYKTDDENSLLAGCAVVTRDTTSTPRVTTIDFGTGCTGADGKLRTGKIIVTHDGRYRDAGTTITITFDNYTVNGNQVSGTRTIHNDGPNNDGNLSYSISVNGQIILASGAGTITWSATRTRVWIAGESTATRDDDQYSITGSATGTAANGDQFTSTIQTALVRNLAPGCRRHFVSGIALIQRTGKPDRTLDFGTGACDDQATVTINGVSRTITLR